MLSLTFFVCVLFFFFKQKTAYEVRISDWSSDVCFSDLLGGGPAGRGWRGACGGGACEGAASARRSLWRGVPGGGCGGDRVAQCRREVECGAARECGAAFGGDRKSTRLNSSH